MIRNNKSLNKLIVLLLVRSISMQRAGTLLFCTLIISCSAQQNVITVENAWIREAPPNASAMAGYMTIHNPTTQDWVLIFAESEDFSTIEIHRTIVTNGVARMRHQAELPIAAGSSLGLKPGDLHFMLMGPKRPFKANNGATISLHFKNADITEKIGVTFPIRKH